MFFDRFSNKKNDFDNKCWWMKLWFVWRIQWTSDSISRLLLKFEKIVDSLRKWVEVWKILETNRWFEIRSKKWNSIENFWCNDLRYEISKNWYEIHSRSWRERSIDTKINEFLVSFSNNASDCNTKRWCKDKWSSNRILNDFQIRYSDYRIKMRERSFC